jgi:uncharacterized protein YbgA (DUF1722 family)/uncharacterized protein YbbK (DUF523 family)
MRARIRIGISSCLLGEQVRYDGGHKCDPYIQGTLGRYVELVPVCPEVGIGLGVPRAPIRLVGRPGVARAVGREDPTLDVTAKLAAYGRRMARKLDDVSGYVFKHRSPSCGLERVPVYDGARVRAGRGIYADAFLALHPCLPAEEEGRLGDPDLRDNFLERVFVYRRWQDMVAAGITAARLAQFHAAHELALMAHNPRAVRELGRLVARAGRGRVGAAADVYLAGLMRALTQCATPARHENALRHLMGYCQQQLDRRDKSELLDTIRRYRRGKLPRAAALALLRHHFYRHPDPDIARQTYLYTDPREQMLRCL